MHGNDGAHVENRKNARIMKEKTRMQRHLRLYSFSSVKWRGNSCRSMAFTIFAGTGTLRCDIYRKTKERVVGERDMESALSQLKC